MVSATCCAGSSDAKGLQLQDGSRAMTMPTNARGDELNADDAAAGRIVDAVSPASTAITSWMKDPEQVDPPSPPGSTAAWR